VKIAKLARDPSLLSPLPKRATDLQEAQHKALVRFLLAGEIR
jgi:hypothetical protein